MAPSKVIAFDLFGTLLSTESIHAELGKLLGVGDDKSKSIAAAWRRYQLEYTWRINSMGETPPLHPSLTFAQTNRGAGLYWNFSQITRAALYHAVDEAGLSL